MSEHLINWDAPPLDPGDEALIDAYMTIGRAVDDLPYTEEFRDLCRRVGASDNDSERRRVFKRLLRLRKMGRLPRLGVFGE